MEKGRTQEHPRQDLRALLEERNKQNAFLREQLVARIEHASHLETRLLYTLDTLDELQASSTRELQQTRHENARLIEKLRVWETIAREADTEKSDMSNAVLELAAKVESCNDYSKWRAARIEFSHDIALQPMKATGTSRATSSRTKQDECTCAQAYAPAIVEELSTSLAREKQAHALSIEDAERRIAALQSRIAVRDAEIARRTAICRCLPPSFGSHASTHLELMSEEEQARVTRRTTERGRTLDLEVMSLHGKVLRERQSRKSASLVDQCVQTEPHDSSRALHSSAKTQAYTVPLRSEDRDDDDSVLGALSTLDAKISQLQKRLTDLVMEKEALQYALRDETAVQDCRVSPSPRKRRRFERNQPTVPSMPPESDNSRPLPHYDDDDDDDRDDFTNILLLEEECIRLMHSENSLRSSLEQLQKRNDFLVQENTRLKREISRLRSSEDRPAEQLSPLSLPQLDTSMSAIDLSFPPLQPDVLSPVQSNLNKGEGDARASDPHEWKDPASSGSSASSSSSPLTPTSAIDPSEVPLPRTPTFDDPETELSIQDDDSDEVPDAAREPQLPITPTGHQDRPLSPPPDATDRPPERRDAQAIERELAEARAEAESREREIAEVRDLMADLALRINNDLQEQS